MTLALFIIFGVIAVICALAMVLSRNPVYGAVFLVGTLMSVAVEFLLLSAPLLAVFQVLIYAGAIMVLYLFVIMLLNLGAQPNWRWWKSLRTWAAFVLVAAIAFVTLRHVGSESPTAPLDALVTNARQIAHILYGTPVMIFYLQALAVLLLIAVIGAIYLGQRITPAERALLDDEKAGQAGTAEGTA